VSVNIDFRLLYVDLRLWNVDFRWSNGDLWLRYADLMLWLIYLRSGRLWTWLNDLWLRLHRVNNNLRLERLWTWLNDLWLLKIDCGYLLGNEFNHHSSITLTALEAPLALHSFSIIFSAFCAIAKIVTLVENSVLTSVLLYKVKVIRFSRSNCVHQAAVDIEISNLISALTLNQTLVYQQHQIHGEFLTILLPVSSPKLRSGRLRHWLNDLWLRLHVNFNLRLMDDNLGSHDRNLRRLNDNLGSHDRNFRRLNDNLGSHDRNFRLLNDNLGSHDRNLRLLNDNLWSHYRNIHLNLWLLNHSLGGYNVYIRSYDCRLRLNNLRSHNWDVDV